MRKNTTAGWLLFTMLMLSQLSPAQENKTGGRQNDKEEYNLVTTKPLYLSGYTQVRYQAPEGRTNGFDVRRARISLKGKLSDRMSYKLQTELGGSSQKLLDAELAFTLFSYAKISTGQFKIPFSQENLTSSSDLATINRSQVVEALTARSRDVIGNQNGRDIGVMLSGTVGQNARTPLFDYALGVFNGSGINTSDQNRRKDVIGRGVFHPVKDMGLGGSFYVGKYTPANGEGSTKTRQRIGAEFSYAIASLSLTFEYITGKDDIIKKAGWYIQAGLIVVPEKLQGVLKFDTYDRNTSTPDNSNRVSTIGANIFFDKKSKLQLNYELKDEQGAEEINNSFIAQLQFGF
jgi:phosphate-selective porin OprO/OprP